jgi:hypothetical protein
VADNTTILKWITLTEKELNNFEVERSDDGLNFKNIGVVKAVGNSSITNNYSFLDYTSFNEIKYYRLKQVDANGKYSYSKTISIHNNLKSDEIGIFPNPVSDLMILQSKGINKKSLDIELMNINGQIVKRQQFLQGSTICYLETKSIANGTYFLSVSDGTSKKVYKVIVNH